MLRLTKYYYYKQALAGSWRLLGLSQLSNTKLHKQNIEEKLLYQYQKSKLKYFRKVFLI
jgi:hypothetical protein